MKKYLLNIVTFVIAACIHTIVMAEESHALTDDKMIEDILSLKKERDYMTPQIDLTKRLLRQFHEYSESESYSVDEFERMASETVDSLVSRQNYIAAGVLLQDFFNILLPEYTGENAASHNMHYLMTSAAEYYLHAGIDWRAEEFIRLVMEFCIKTGRTSGNHWLRNCFNLSTLLVNAGNPEQGNVFYELAMREFLANDRADLSPYTINAMLRSALCLVGRVPQSAFSDMISFITGEHPLTEENALLQCLFIAKCMHHYDKDYKTAYNTYEIAFNSEMAEKAYEIALTDAMETAWHVGRDEYASMVFVAGNIGRSLIEEKLNSFSINDTEQYWDRMAERLNHAYGLTFNLDQPDIFLITGARLNTVFTKSLSTQTHTEMTKSIREHGKGRYSEVLEELLDYRRKIGNITDRNERDAISRKISQLEWSLRLGWDFTPEYALNHNKAVVMPSCLDDDECQVEIVEYPMLVDDEEMKCFGAIICTSVPKEDSYGIRYRAEQYEFVNLGSVLIWDIIDGADRLTARERAAQYRHGQNLSVASLMFPLMERISGYRRAYVSPGGVISTINIGALPWGSGDSIFNDKVEIVQIHAAYDVAEIKKRDARLSAAAVFSDIDYNTSDPQVSVSASGDALTSGYRLSLERGSHAKKFMRLPVDVTRLSGNIGRSVRDIKAFSGVKASEEAFKSYDGKAPDLIHIDTHGFYIPDGDQIFVGKHVMEGTRERALLTCGLAMSGANHAWSGEDVDPGKEDGILTGWEIACMDLSGCRLAVLSACETARGDVDNINGILGLQRALKLAGAEAMLLTLWPVDNELTEEFVNDFYSRLPDSDNFNEAFLATQRKFRKLHPDPYYWAPFILIN